MKFTAYAAMILAAGAVAGSAMAQANAPQTTMQPVPNPPEKVAMAHGGKHHHHMAMRHHHMAKHHHHHMAKADKAADAAAKPK
ncbi:MAG TPA: hypothetical protein VG248_05385 [Caulobacteraceae bacterium]|jgi:hypothetical protein|nr:hypothetical protein [Caulobacteraceae bacterium]